MLHITNKSFLAACCLLVGSLLALPVKAESENGLAGLSVDTPDAIDATPFEYEDNEALRDVTPMYGRRISVCAGQSLSGWAIYDVRTDFTQCGGGWDSVWMLIELNGARPGQSTVVCTRSRVPPGWVTVGYRTDFTRCGRNPGRNNLKVIRFP